MPQVTLFRQTKDGKELPTWWLYYRRHGKTFRKSTGTADDTEAEKARTQLEKMLAFDRRDELTEDFFRATRNLDRKEIPLADFLPGTRATITSKGTAGEYKTVDRDFLAFLKERFPSVAMLHELRSTHVEDWVKQMLADGYKPNTVNKKLKIIRIALNIAFNSGLVFRDPSRPVKYVKASEPNKRCFTEKELRLICSSAEGYFRYTAALGLYTAARLGDIVCLRWRDVDLKRGFISFQMRKRRGKAMEIPMHPSLKAVLTELAQESECRPSDYLFPDRAEKYLKRGSPSISGEWVRFLAKLGIVNRSRAYYKKRARLRSKLRKAGKATPPTISRTPSELSFHSFRHSAVSLLKNIGAPEAVAMQIAGHESASISRIYTHLDEASERRWIAKMPDFIPSVPNQEKESKS